VLGLRYLDGGRPRQRRGRRSRRRRRFHHFSFYGFPPCFAATRVATRYHYGLGGRAPYLLLSLPVLLGTLGGIGLPVGPAGLPAALAARPCPSRRLRT
jgi:citrate/tricarballylate utilization protein